jgi:hypothetical protein
MTTDLTNTLDALRKRTRSAKRGLTHAARDLKAAVADHLAAVRCETRTVPLYLDIDSDRAIDALNRAAERYKAAADRVLSANEEEKRAASAVEILRKL